jgi:hypothetical protein
LHRHFDPRAEISVALWQKLQRREQTFQTNSGRSRSTAGVKTAIQPGTGRACDLLTEKPFANAGRVLHELVAPLEYRHPERLRILRKASPGASFSLRSLLALL